MHHAMKCLEIHRMLPSLRYYLAHELYKRGCSQEHIAKKLMISQANVSYYLKNKRVKTKIKLPKELLNSMAEDLMKTNSIADILCKYCELLIQLKNK